MVLNGAKFSLLANRLHVRCRGPQRRKQLLSVRSQEHLQGEDDPGGGGYQTQDPKCPVQGHRRGGKLGFSGHTIRDLCSGFRLVPDDNGDLLKMLKLVA